MIPIFMKIQMLGISLLMKKPAMMHTASKILKQKRVWRILLAAVRIMKFSHLQ